MTALAGMPSAYEQLVVAAQHGSRGAADALVRDHRGWVRAVVFGVTGRDDRIDDIEQQVWANVWERLGSLKDPQRLKPWLYSVARHAALDACEAESRQRALVRKIGERSSSRDGSDSCAHDPRRAMSDSELGSRVMQAIRELPSIYRETFALRHLEDWSYAQIAEALDISVDTVETRLTRARRLLRERLSPALGSEVREAARQSSDAAARNPDMK